MMSDPTKMADDPRPDDAADAAETPQDDEAIRRALWGSLAVFALVAAVAGGIFWWNRRPEPAPAAVAAPIELPQDRPPASAPIPHLPFVEVAREAGITFVHESGAAGEKLLPETMGSGCAFLDYDGDGDQDVLLLNGKRWDGDAKDADGPRPTQALYRNDGTGKFEDVTAEAGLDFSLYATGAAAGDYDNDGRADLFIASLGADRLLHNDGGRFTDVTDAAGLTEADPAWGTSCGFFDYDNDGDLDLFVCHYLEWSKEYDLAQDFQLTGGGRAYGRPQNFAGTASRLCRNDGDGTFTDVTTEAGIEILHPDTGGPMGKALGVTFADFDEDGRLDIFVANDTVQNFLFHNRGDGTFAEVGAAVGVAFGPAGEARGAMGIDAAYIRGDRDLGVAIGNFANEMTALYVTPRGELQFTDEAVSNGLGPATRLELTFGTLLCDLDLDGRPDLFAANGHLEEDISKVISSQTYKQPAHLFWNAGPESQREFLPVPAAKSGPDITTPTVGRGAAYADIDADGDLDLLTTCVDGPPQLLRNDQRLGRHWLRVKLVGTRANRDAIGAVVEVETESGVLRQRVMPTRSYQSQVELPLTFGLGTSNRVNRLRITWPGGEVQEVPAGPVDRLITIAQPKQAGL
jgi:hypothetical protein